MRARDDRPASTSRVAAVLALLACLPLAADAAAPDRRGEADALYAAVELERAAAIYQELVAAQPTNASLRIRLADCLTRTDRFVDAIDQARQAVELTGGGAEALGALGLALFRKGDFAAAAERLRAGVAADPRCAACLWGLARVQAIQGDYVEAGSNFQKAAAIEPENPIYLRALASYVSDRDKQKELYRGYLELPRREEEGVYENAKAWLKMLEFAGDRPLGRADIPAGGTEVELEVRGGVCYAPVVLDGKRKLRYLVDTGASGLTISSGTLKRLKLEVVAAYTITGIGGKGTVETRLALVPEVRVGEAVIRNVPAVVSDSLPLVDGLLGPTLFGGAAVTIDQPGRKLRIGRVETPPVVADGKSPPPPIEIPFLSINGTPFIPVSVNGVAMNAMVDTGGSQAVLSRFAAEAVPGLELMAPALAPPGYREIRGSTGSNREVRVVRRATVVYPGGTIDMAAHLPDAERILVTYDLTPFSHGLGTEVWAILGNPQLDGFALTVDWEHQLVRLQRPR